MRSGSDPQTNRGAADADRSGSRPFAFEMPKKPAKSGLSSVASVLAVALRWDASCCAVDLRQNESPQDAAVSLPVGESR
jgi:hypothetical protein